MTELWKEFLLDREHCTNATKKTLRSYSTVWKIVGPLFPQTPAELNNSVVRQIVVRLRQRETLSAISVKSYLRVVNAFLHWLFKDGHTDTWLRVGLKEIKCEIPVPRTFTVEELRTILRAEPKNARERRVIRFAWLLLDTGLRAQEALQLQRQDVNLEKMSIVVMGKGRKGREVAISHEWKRRFWKDLSRCGSEEYLFSTSHGTAWSYRNSVRDFVELCARLGISGPKLGWHTFRHTFATTYIRKGGDLRHLQRLLGHSNITMTSRYVTLNTEDLTRGHGKYTMLEDVSLRLA